MLEKRGIGNGLCPRNVSELAEKTTNKEGFREGLKYICDQTKMRYKVDEFAVAIGPQEKAD